MVKRVGMTLLVSGLLVLGAATADAQWGNSYWGTLWAGQYSNAGTYALRISADCSYLRVRLIPNADEGWEISEYHVDIVSDPMNFPTNPAGNPKVGHFAWSASFPPTSQAKTFYVLPEEVNGPVMCGDMIYVAIHAVMQQRDAAGNIIREETAWGGPCGWGRHAWDPRTDLPDGFFEFPGNRWDFYLSFLWEGATPP